jgi:DNA-binding transcriptional MerR regulator
VNDRTRFPLRIGEFAATLQLNAKTVRYYEAIGLLPAPRRNSSGYRLYGRAEHDRLRFVVKAKALGFTLREIQQILSLRDAGCEPCPYLRDLLAQKLVDIDARLQQLSQLRAELVTLQADGGDRVLEHPDLCCDRASRTGARTRGAAFRHPRTSTSPSRRDCLTFLRGGRSRLKRSALKTWLRHAGGTQMPRVTVTSAPGLIAGRQSTRIRCRATRCGDLVTGDPDERRALLPITWRGHQSAPARAGLEPRGVGSAGGGAGRSVVSTKWRLPAGARPRRVATPGAPAAHCRGTRAFSQRVIRPLWLGGCRCELRRRPRTMFQDAVPTCSTRPAALHQLLRSSTETSDHELVYISDFSHLHQSVARSHTLIAQSRAIAAQSRALCDRYERQHLSFVNERAAPSAACSCSVHHSPTVHAPIDRSTMTPLPSETKTAGSVDRRRRRTTTRSVWRMVSSEPGRIRCPCAKRRRPLLRSRFGVDLSRGRALHPDTLSSRC